MQGYGNFGLLKLVSFLVLKISYKMGVSFTFAVILIYEVW